MLVYVRNGLTVLPCENNSDFNQYCKFKIGENNDTKYVYLVYRPPSAGQLSKDKLCVLLGQAEKNSIFIGDFNLPGIDWQNVTAQGSDVRIVEAAQESGLTQLMHFPTHINGGCLELVLKNVPEKVSSI